MIGTYIISSPVTEAREDAWFSIFVSFVTALILALITITVAKLHLGKTLVGVLISCFGKTAGKLISVIYLLFVIYFSATIPRSLGHYSITVSYIKTPEFFLSMCYLLVVFYLVSIGLEPMGRISEVFLVVLMAITCVSLVSFATNFDADYFMPMFKNGMGTPAYAGLKVGLVPFGEFFLMLNILPNLNDKKKTARTLILTVLVSCAVLLLFTVRNQSILGIDLASRNIYSSEKVFKLIPGFVIIPLLDINVIISGIIKVALVLYYQAKILGDIFDLKDFKIFVPPCAALDLAISAKIYRSLFTQIYNVGKVLPLIYIPVYVIIPLIVLVISLIKKGNKPNSPVSTNKATGI
jgi:spore germination protein KB